MPAKLLVEIAGDATSAVNAIKKTESASKDAGGAADKTGVSFAGVAKAVATGYAVSKIVDFGKETVKAAEDSAVAHERLVAVFKAGGDASGKAAADAEKYAGVLSKQTGIDDEVVMGAQAILATFHSLTTPTANQADLFNRATAAAADLAAAGFGDLNSNAVQLGKALQDPTKGMAALARSGVTFTDAQKEQIKALQQSGDLLGAQKVVMGAVEDQVKGTAAATATSSAKMQTEYENLKEAIGTALLPAINSIVPVLTGLFDFIAANSDWLVPIVIAVAGAAGALFVLGQAISVISGIVSAFRVVWLLLNSSFLASPIGLIIVGVVALIAVIVLIATKTTWFQTIWATVTGAMVVAWNATTGAIVAAWNAVYGFVSGVFSAIVAAWNASTGAIVAVWNGAYSVIAGVFGAIQSVAASVLGWIRSNWPLLLGILTGPFGLAVAAVINYWTPITGFFSSIVSRIGGAVSGVVSAITGPFRTAFDIVKGIVGDAVGWISSKVASVMSVVTGAINTAKGVYNAFARTWNGISVKMPEIDTHIPGVGKVGGFTIGLPSLPILAAGGLMTRSGLIYAHAGEVISPAPASARGARSGPLVNIAHAHFSEKVDVDAFGKRLAWQVQTAGV